MASHGSQARSGAEPPGRSDVRRAWTVSVLALVWTCLSAIAAVAIGIAKGSLVLVAFGAIGLVDALGSAALAYHFGRGLRHESLSERLEQLAHRIVLVGMTVVGVGAVAGGGLRLIDGAVTEASALGTALAAVSLAVLAGLSAWKQRVAARVGSPALRSDGHLSAVGAGQAAVTLLGTLTTRIGWHWADPVAAAVVGCVALSVSVRTGRP
ncbi:MAG TPA: cation transporter [Acidimicrobiia bacterium]|nr:cation transporter [Acidimicrobiia bacterium]